MAPAATALVKRAVPNAIATVGRLEETFARCYRAALADDPKAQGTVKIAMQVGASGEVLTASAQGLKDLPPPVVVCLLEAARRAQFDEPPGKTPVTLVPPLNFVVKD